MGLTKWNDIYEKRDIFLKESPICDLFQSSCYYKFTMKNRGDLAVTYN